MRVSVALFALLLALLSRVDAAERPNVIVIFTDDHGWADLGAQGIEKDIRTPNLDALAAGGLRATNGYVSAPQCVPSRAGLLSGRYQNRFGVESNGEPLDGFDAQETIAERLKKVGYATGMAGKWHLGPAPQITEHGFDDVYFCQGGQSGSANFDLEGNTVSFGPRRDQRYHLDANSDAACAFIERHQNEPFFFYVAHRGPHVPLDAPRKYLDRFPGEMPERRRQALGMISAIDDGVGRIMATLREHGLEEKTLIFFMSDNGAPLKLTKEDEPGGGPGWDGSHNAPMNGEKGMLSEGGIRVPWLAYWKGKIPAGQVYEHPVISLDVAATALALAGEPNDPKLDGVNLMPYFSGETTAAPHDVLYWRWIAQSAVREGKWKLLVGGRRSYLFDLESDPGERDNLIEQHPAIARRLRARLEEWSQELQPPGIGSKPMSEVWERYFDVYLDGKSIANTRGSEGKGRSGEWVVRGGKAEVEQGFLKVTAAGKEGQSPFIAFTGMRMAGPAEALVTLRSEGGGKVGVAWRTSEQKEFPPGQTSRQEIEGSPELQAISISMPATGEIVHLRVMLPAGVSRVRRVELMSDRSVASKVWDFESN